MTDLAYVRHRLAAVEHPRASALRPLAETLVAVADDDGGRTVAYGQDEVVAAQMLARAGLARVRLAGRPLRAFVEMR